MLTPEQAYKKLEALIKHRQELESQPSFPTDLIKTDLNFFDVEGNTLLHYAILMGDIDRVKWLVENGANINLETRLGKSPIATAISNDQKDIAEFIFKQGAKLHKTVFEIPPKNINKWFYSVINDALDEAYPLAENDTVNPVQPSQKKENQFFEKSESGFAPFYRAAQTGNMAFITKFAARFPDFLYAILQQSRGYAYFPVLNAAAANGQHEVVKYFLDHGAQLNPEQRYKEHPLHLAIKYQQKHMIDFLLANLSNTTDIEWENNVRNTPLMEAVVNNDLETTDLLLKKGANINHLNVNGRNSLHLAVTTGNLALITRLLKEQSIEPLITTADIYGFTPLDLAIQAGNEEIIKLLAPRTDLAKVRTLPSFGHLPISINQFEIMKKMYFYLLLNYRSTEFFSQIGHCNGFEYLFQFYAARGMTDYFYQTLELISGWDGEQSSLDKPFGDIPQAKYYKNLRELMEQWINDITWFQQLTIQAAQLEQYQRIQQHTIISGELEYQPNIFFYYRGKTIQGEPVMQDKDCLLEYLKYFARLPTESRLEITGGRHATGAYINDNREIIYYDPTFLYRNKLPLEYSGLFPHIFDYKYIFLKQVSEGHNIQVALQLFYFNKDKVNLYENNVFSEEELPKSTDEADLFQHQSPNKFTHLHVAVTMRSLVTLKKLLKDGFCDINAEDKLGRTPLSIALRQDFLEAVDLLLSNPNLKLSGNEILTAYDAGNIHYIQKLLPLQDSITIYHLFVAAINKGDYSLIEDLIKIIDVNQTSPVTYQFPLVDAITSGDEKIVTLLLKKNPNVTQASEFGIDVSALQKVFQIGDFNLYQQIIAKLAEINTLDGKGNAAIHYAVRYEKLDLIKDLIAKGANVNLRNINDESPLELDIRCTSNKELMKIIYPHLKFNLGIPAENKSLLKLIAYSIKQEDKELFDLWLQNCNKGVLNSYTEGYNALQHAIRNKQFDMAEKLINAGADIDMKFKKKGLTCLHYMIKNKYEKKYFDLFLKHKASIDIPDDNNKTARDYLADANDPTLETYFQDYAHDVTKPKI